MSYDVLMRQARAAALGFWPGPLDGRDGPRTRKAIADATAAQAAKGLPFQHPSGITQVRLHWSAGAHTPNATDRMHYHCLIWGDGSVEWAHQPTAHLSHTRSANSGAVALSAAAMAGAVERPFSRGKFPATPIQVAAMAREAARVCLEYNIPVTRWSVMSHAEVQPTLGIAQRQKWDWTWLPGFAAPQDPITTGDRLRKMIAAEVEAQR